MQVPADNVFLLTSDQTAPRNSLLGFAFCDSDLIIGGDGYEKYLKARGRPIPPGEDGAYVVVFSSDARTVIGTDFCGYYKLFLYRAGTEWAVSNSILRLVEHAKSRGLPTTISPSHLASFFIVGSFGNQLASTRTAIREIELIPSCDQIEIDHTQHTITISRTDRCRSLDNEKISYRDALERALHAWSARFAAILQSDMDVKSDLTGGRDSRAVLSLFLRAAKSLGQPSLLNRVSFTSDPNALDDYKIAEGLAQAFGLSLNIKKANHPSPLLHPEDRFRKWISLCLGSYGPIYFPVRAQNSKSLAMGGAGGEAHRNFYIAPNICEFLDARRRFFRNDAFYEEFRSDVLSDIHRLKVGYEVGLDPLIIHYRYFRDRLHGGRTPQYVNFLNPLASHLFRSASAILSPNLRVRSQLLVDIIANGASGLEALPYDREAKMPDDQHVRDLTPIPVGRSCDPGEVFCGEWCETESKANRPNTSTWQLLHAEILQNEPKFRNFDIFTDGYIDNAIHLVKHALEKNSLPHPVDGCSISHLIFAGHIAS